MFETCNVGWTLDSQEVGAAFTHKLTQCLWYLDPHHQKFVNRGIALPVRFNSFQGYNDYKRKKEREPRLSAQELDHHIDVLSGVLMQPWFANTRFTSLQKDVAELVNVMQKYVLYLTSQSEKVQAHHLCNTSKDTESSATLITLPAKNELILECYKELYQRLATLPLYELLF